METLLIAMLGMVLVVLVMGQSTTGDRLRAMDEKLDMLVDHFALGEAGPVPERLVESVSDGIRDLVREGERMKAIGTACEELDLEYDTARRLVDRLEAGGDEMPSGEGN